MFLPLALPPPDPFWQPSAYKGGSELEATEEGERKAGLEDDALKEYERANM